MKNSYVWIIGGILGLSVMYLGEESVNNPEGFAKDIRSNSGDSTQSNVDKVGNEGVALNVKLASSEAKSMGKETGIGVVSSDSDYLSEDLNGAQDWLSGVGEASHPINVDDAFKHVVYKDGDFIIAEWEIGDQYKLYSDKLTIELIGYKGDTVYPKGKKYVDGLGVESTVYSGVIQVKSNISGFTGKTIEVLSKYQGCWDGGVCYPPVEKNNIIEMN